MKQKNLRVREEEGKCGVAAKRIYREKDPEKLVGYR
jgi:hypothetical protein